ncbi:MAG: hypothetical protein JO185_26640 [Acidobacteriaceae bacterium]|nr:hypothetical protein [Acidobacteriaceae bacterium]MBV9305188.1 hypothetical protein [Acidobacteriaceae bacterium]MBV9679942.1 hypothetical protein [Acidobacteriaceae bacterium]
MKERAVVALAILLNVVISFATDGQWKTAGLSLMIAYWRLNRICSKPYCTA